MKLSPSQQESIIALLTRIYLDIRDIEEEYQLLAGEHDFRPRIEYFHDAIRALSSEDPKARQTGGRLSIELLAYDLSCLRYIQAMPLAPFKPHGEVFSGKTDITKVEQGLVVKAKRPDRAIKERLVELYQHYAVLFAAVLKPFADNDFNERVGDLNQDVTEINQVIQKLEALGKGKGTAAAVTSTVSHLEEAELRTLLLAFMNNQLYKKKEEIKKLIQFLKQEIAKKDREIAGIESAHMNYALAQLGIFEESKAMLKKMAAQGMNLIGRFVEEAMAAARREMGR